MKTIVYSAIYGDYDKPINQCINRRPILFSDHDWEGNPMQDKAHEYFIRKWGGFPRQHKFKTPFNK